MFEFLQSVLRKDEVPKEVTEAHLVMIPKEKKPNSIKSFRPISLCNTRIKLVTKMVVNSLKPLLRDLIAPYQSAFILGRHSIENVIIHQEIIHTMRYTKSRIGGMILKLEKVNDRLEWGFVEETMRDARLLNELIKVVMSLIRRSHCMLLWNVELTHIIRPTSGL